MMKDWLVKMSWTSVDVLLLYSWGLVQRNDCFLQDLSKLLAKINYAYEVCLLTPGELETVKLELGYIRI